MSGHTSISLKFRIKSRQPGEPGRWRRSRHEVRSRPRGRLPHCLHIYTDFYFNGQRRVCQKDFRGTAGKTSGKGCPDGQNGPAGHRMGKTERRNCHGRAMPNTPWTGKRTKRKSLPGSGSASWATTPMPAPSPGRGTGETRPRPQPSSSRPWSPRRSGPDGGEDGAPRPPMFPEAASGSTATFPGTMPRGFGAPSVWTARRCSRGLIRRELADCRGTRPSPAGPGGGPRPGAGRAGWRKRRAKRLSAAYFSSPGCATGRRRSARR